MSNNKTNPIVALSVTLVVAATVAWTYAIDAENVKAMALVGILAPAFISLAGFLNVELPIRAAFGEPQLSGTNYVRPTESTLATAIVGGSVFAGYALALVTLANTLTSIRPTMLHIPCLIAAAVSAAYAFVLVTHAVRIKKMRQVLQLS